MATNRLLKHCPAEIAQLERVNFFPRQLLTDGDMIADQEYFREKLRRHNRYLHGWGVVCGLEVTEAREKGPGWVRVGPGYALSPCGDDIHVGEPVFLDLAKCGPQAITDPCLPERWLATAAPSGTIFLAIRYDQCLARPMQIMPATCVCDELACEYSRIRDSFQFECLTALPASHDSWPPAGLLCQGAWPCPPEPPDPWVVLAQITLRGQSLIIPTANTGQNEVIAMGIDQSLRRHIYSTAILQKELLECCCDEKPAPVAKADLEITGELKDNYGQVTNDVNLGITGTFTVTNHGTATAINTVVMLSLQRNRTDIPPSGIKSLGQFIYKESETEYQINIGELTKDTPKQYTIIIKYVPGEYTYHATVTSDTKDSNNYKHYCDGSLEIKQGGID